MSAAICTTTEARDLRRDDKTAQTHAVVRANHKLSTCAVSLALNLETKRRTHVFQIHHLAPIDPDRDPPIGFCRGGGRVRIEQHELGDRLPSVGPCRPRQLGAGRKHRREAPTLQRGRSMLPASEILARVRAGDSQRSPVPQRRESSERRLLGVPPL